VPNPPLLDRRALNRATLARQLLVERSALDVPAVVEHLVGLQAQTPQTWYVSLWSRIVGFDPELVSVLLGQHQLVRISLMRSTIHLVTADDALGLRPLFDAVNARAQKTIFGKRLGDVDHGELRAAARALLAERPLTFAELGAALAQHWPAVEPTALAQSVRALEPLVQVPPRGLWGRSGPVAHTTAEVWLGRPLVASPSVEDLVLRYLAAFGPASVADVQNWSGLTRLAPVLDQLRPRLLTYVGEGGRELFDLPDAPRPDRDSPVPVRFLADFDNLLLGHADRSRFVSDGYRQLGFPANGQVPRPFLVDGFTAGTWRVTVHRRAWTLTVEPFERITRQVRAALEQEAGDLLRFLSTAADPGPDVLDVHLVDPR
jgi:Winged helix DNA-binding domain